MTGVERLDQTDAALDEVLASADEAVLAALHHGLDRDAGRAAIHPDTQESSDSLLPQPR